MIVETSRGAVRGVVENGVARFLGIPYAAPPFGEDRFAHPRPHDSWEGVRDATSHGPTSPQTPYPGELGTILPTRRIPGHEILNLNVWAPAAPNPAGRPVMVWFHGGGLTRGSNALETYDGTAFARDGVVLVSVNYRLGAEGFSMLDDAPANLGVADQLAALHWIQDNISAFGGDPTQVTVFGQSAGGMSVAALVTRPEAASLMSGAIVMSAPLAATAPRKAARITRVMARDLGVPPTRRAFAEVTPEALLASQTRAGGGGSPIGGGASFGIVVDGDVVPEDPELALCRGAASGIRLMLGYTSEEYRLWFLPTLVIDKIRSIHLLAARLKLRVPRAAARLYRRNRPEAPAGEILGMLASDVLLRQPTFRVADARGGKTWVYEFAWRSPVLDLGAAHALELGFVFDTLASAEATAFAGPGRPQLLADELHAAWVRFATEGDPGWPAWDATRPVMTFGHPESKVVRAPRDDERRALDRGTV